MNSVQLSGTIQNPPVIVNTRNSIYFMLKVPYPSDDKNSRPEFAYIPCGVFDATPKQREILLGKPHRNIRVEACGRLEDIVMQDERGKKSVSLGVHINPNGLLLQRLR